MLDKIKITVPKYTYDILLKDCQNFEFYKNEETLNRNLFLNTLIVNYYEKFTFNENSLKDDLLKEIDDNDTLDKILQIIKKNEYFEDSNKTEVINLKPTKLSEKQIIFIENNLINNNSISSFYRNLFNSYAHTPQNHRELIIFKDNYETLLSSIQKERQVTITLKNGDVINNASVYKIENSKEEMFNYVLVSGISNTPITIRLSKIKYVSLLNSKRNISEEVILTFERQIKYGVEYPFYSSNEEEVVVKLTEKGKNLFKKMYVYRPIPDKIDGNLYYFNCSHNQILHYFKRFGYDAIIVSPTSISQKMFNYHYIASEKYKKIMK